jgi:sirohydrochlorin cobaltochelatase
MTSAIILFAHGAREPEWARPLEAVRERLRAGGTRTELAFLESMSPSLEEAAGRLVGEGFEKVVVVPLFLAQGRHLRLDFPAMVSRIRERHATTEFRVTPALGDAPEIVAAITDWIRRAAF